MTSKASEPTVTSDLIPNAETTKALEEARDGHVVHFETVDALFEDLNSVTSPPMPEGERPGRMLKGLRLRAEMTRAELAEALGVDQGRIGEYEANSRPVPADQAEKLAIILKTVPSNFLRSPNHA